MSIEVERRYSLTSEQYQELLNAFSWSNPKFVEDLTFGLSGKRSFHEHGWICRIRSLGDTAFLQFKGKKGISSSTEYSTRIDDKKSCMAILSAMGLTTGFLISRTRRLVSTDLGVMALDEVDFIGKFVELESSSEARIAAMEKMLRPFGINPSNSCGFYGDILEDILTNNIEANLKHRKRIDELISIVINK